MWFRFPPGTKGITVQQQEFGVEATDEAGDYFRAPDHFAGIILDLPGFAMAKPPEGAPADLPKPDPERDGAVEQLGGQIERLKLELDGANARLAEISAERDDLRKRNFDLGAQVKNLEGDLEEARIESTTETGSKRK